MEPVEPPKTVSETRAEKNSSSTVTPLGQSSSTSSSDPSGPSVQIQLHLQPSHRFLSAAEWARVAHGLGAVHTGADHIVVHPTCPFWPPKGLPDGLYREVVTERTKYKCLYHAFNTVRWVLMLLQIIIGAVLTSLGSLSDPPGITITILAACNTIDAGLIALLHNSGLPQRYQSNKYEFCRAADHIRELLDTGIVESAQTADDVISGCFRKVQDAKATVRANMPSNYISSNPVGAGRRKRSSNS